MAHTLKEELIKKGFKAGDADPIVFYRFRDSDSIEIAGWYIDNRLLVSNSDASMDRMINDIGGSFDIQDLGDPDCLLGVCIICDKDHGTIHISQPTFIDTIARHFDISTGQSISSPMCTSMILSQCADAEGSINVPYTSLIGSLNYCAIATQPDISYAMNKCTQYTSKSTITHWEAAKHIVCYLLCTREY